MQLEQFVNCNDLYIILWDLCYLLKDEAKILHFTSRNFKNKILSFQHCSFFTYRRLRKKGRISWSNVSKPFQIYPKAYSTVLYCKIRRQKFKLLGKKKTILICFCCKSVNSALSALPFILAQCNLVLFKTLKVRLVSDNTCQSEVGFWQHMSK